MACLKRKKSPNLYKNHKKLEICIVYSHYPNQLLIINFESEQECICNIVFSPEQRDLKKIRKGDFRHLVPNVKSIKFR